MSVRATALYDSEARATYVLRGCPSLALVGPARCGAFEQPARGEHERVVARSTCELDGRGKPIFRRSARQRQRQPAEHIERVGEADRSIPDRQLVRLDSAVRSGTCSANTIDPYVVTSPAVSNRSLTASGIPSAGRSGRARKIE
jgi:hypothetical protein